jgi:hypothetical protein
MCTLLLPWKLNDRGIPVWDAGPDGGTAGVAEAIQRAYLEGWNDCLKATRDALVRLKAMEPTVVLLDPTAVVRGKHEADEPTPTELGMPWFCDRCGASGVLPPGWDGLEALHCHRAASPDCGGGPDTVRCLPHFGMERDGWVRLGADLKREREPDDADAH